MEATHSSSTGNATSRASHRSPRGSASARGVSEMEMGPTELEGALIRLPRALLCSPFALVFFAGDTLCGRVLGGADLHLMAHAPCSSSSLYCSSSSCPGVLEVRVVAC